MITECNLSRSHILLTPALACGQSLLNTTESELQQLKDTHNHLKKRASEMLTNLLKDLGEVGVAVGGSAADMKVSRRDVGVSRRDVGVGWRDVGVGWRNVGVGWRDVVVGWRGVGVGWRDVRSVEGI